MTGQKVHLLNTKIAFFGVIEPPHGRFFVLLFKQDWDV